MNIVQNEIIDRYTERWVMDHIFVKCNVALCLKACKKADRFTVVDMEKRETHTILAKSVNHLPTWKASLKDTGIDTGAFTTIKQRVEIHQEYLLQKPKSPYLFCSKDEDLSKLHDMIVFSAIIRTTEQRYIERRITDPEVRQRVAIFLAERENNEGMSRAAGHARKHGEDVAQAIDTMYRASLDRIDEIMTPIDWKEPLPSLLEGTHHLLAWAEDEQEEKQDE